MNATAQSFNNSILLPPGRIVQGDLYEPQTEDMQGNPLITKQGPNAGKPRVNYFFAYAIKKTGEQAWWQTQWGARILQIAQAYWPQGQTQYPKFAWKIADGDDTTPNPEANNRRNCDREGYPGHWVIRLGSGFPTKVYDSQGNPLLQPGLVKRGFWVEVLATVNSNENAQKPGIHINHNMVAFRAPDKEIISGPDPKQVGFGKSALPAGVTAAPVGSAQMPSTGVPGVPGGAMPPDAPPMQPQMPLQQPQQPMMPPPGPQGMPPMPGAAPAMPTQQPVTPVVPHQPFLNPPAMGGAMPAVPSAPAVPGVPPAAGGAPSVVCPLGAPMGYKMVNLNGPRYEQFRAQNWTDPMLLQHNHMVRL